MKRKKKHIIGTVYFMCMVPCIADLLSNVMQHKAVYLLFCKFTLHVSGVNHTHHQEYTKLSTASNVTKLAWPRWRKVAAQYQRL